MGGIYDCFFKWGGVSFPMRHLLSVFLLFVSFHMGVEAQEIAPVKVQLENRTVENGRNAWTTPRFRVDADAGILIRADYFLNAVVVQKSRNTPKMDEAWSSTSWFTFACTRNSAVSHSGSSMESRSISAVRRVAAKNFHSPGWTSACAITCG